MVTNDALTPFVVAFVDELRSQGVVHVVISPGSRSTPLALAAADHPELKIWIHLDERAAAFFALGIAKASIQPVALLCTSGTAAANYFPAIIEAKYARIPLIVLTADRPHELREVGAPQAIDQLHLYGNHVQWFHEMPLPDQEPETVRHVRIVARRSVHHAMTEPKGAVHINFPFREPLVPQLNEQLWSNVRAERLSPHFPSIRTLDDASMQQLAQQVRTLPNGLILCGPMHGHDHGAPIIALAERLGYPVFAEPLSQLRGRYSHHPQVIECYDILLKHEEFKHKAVPQVIIRFGAMPVSKPLYQWLKANKDIKQIVVDEGAQWRDPTLLADPMVAADASQFCQQLLQHLAKDDAPKTAATPDWIERWRTCDDAVKQVVLSETLRVEDEGHVFLAIRDRLPPDTGLFVGNSMAIRDCETYFVTPSAQDVAIYCNRGANGIDGVISSALGTSLAHQHNVLILGDLSALHDMNALLLARTYQLSMVIIIVNNDGGGIFSFLPQAQHPKHYESLFGTPHGLQFNAMAAMYGAKYQQIPSIALLQEAVTQGLNEGGLHLLELITQREPNVWSRRALTHRAHQAISNNLSEG
jgi:2-succinyl-5-enolpyruvyl-6-hydroxy-3-cyclohexene-1-carboxylate synthase